MGLSYIIQFAQHSKFRSAVSCNKLIFYQKVENKEQLECLVPKPESGF